MQIVPYLNFPGTCAEAMASYAAVLGGTIEGMITFGDMPDAGEMPEAMKGMVAHVCLAIGDQRLMASDAPPHMYEQPRGTSVSIHVDSPAEAERICAALSAGGAFSMELQETFWALRFAMFTDRFGTPWMINCSRPGPA